MEPEPDLPPLARMMRESFADPRRGIRRVLDLGLPEAVAWQALALVAVLSAMLTLVASLLVPAGSAAMMAGGITLRMQIMQAVLLVVMAGGVHLVGRAMGGQGTLAGAVVTVAWLQAAMLVFQAAQLVAQVVLPPLAPMVALASVAAFFWLLTNFVCELHGFSSRGRVFGTILLAFFALAFVLAFVLGLAGIVPATEV